MPMARLLRLLSAAGLEGTVLVVPRGARAFRDQIDLDLLALYTREHRLQLVMVSADRHLRQRAAEMGLGVSARPPGELLGEEAAGSERPATQPLHLPAWLAVCFFALVFLGAIAMLWPRPTVIVTPARQRLSLTAQARVSPSFRESQIRDGCLPGRLLSKAGLAVYDVAASGSLTVGVTPAQGQVILLNDGGQSLVVPSGVIVQSAGGLRYRTQTAVTVPAAKHGYLLGIRVSSTSGQAQVAVVAELPGTEGNLGPGKLTTLVGPLERQVKVVNSAALAGGTDKRVAVVTREDVERARLEAGSQMELAAPDELKALAGTEQVLLPESIAIKPGRAVESPRVGEVSDSVRVTLPYSAQCLSISRTTLAKFLEEQARRQVPSHFRVAHEPFAIRELSGAPRRTDEAELRIVASYVAIGNLERDRILGALRGRTEAEARTAVLALPEVATVRMDLSPGRRFPRYAWLIRIVTPRQDGQ